MEPSNASVSAATRQRKARSPLWRVLDFIVLLKGNTISRLMIVPLRITAVIGSLVVGVAVVRGQNSVAVDRPFPLFEDVAEKAGIDFQLDSGNSMRAFILESNSAGIVVVDYDNDGWPDLYFVNGSTIERLDAGQKSRGNRLYHNNRDGTFTGVTDPAGGRGNGDWGMGGCIGDVDNNGYDDIFVTNYGKAVLYLNNGDGTFRD